MGRQNRSRKRRDEMNKIKKARYDAKELIRLKKTLGLLDADGKEIKMEIGEVAEIKTSKELKRVSADTYKSASWTYTKNHICRQLFISWILLFTLWTIFVNVLFSSL